VRPAVSWLKESQESLHNQAVVPEHLSGWRGLQTTRAPTGCQSAGVRRRAASQSLIVARCWTAVVHDPKQKRAVAAMAPEKTTSHNLTRTTSSPHLASEPVARPASPHDSPPALVAPTWPAKGTLLSPAITWRCLSIHSPTLQASPDLSQKPPRVLRPARLCPDSRSPVSQQFKCDAASARLHLQTCGTLGLQCVWCIKSYCVRGVHSLKASKP
jgi:hypothetical protein